jgi:phage gp36-like protein
MAYCTQADLEERYGAAELVELTDRDRIGVADATAIARAIADADALVNGYLAGRYTLPLASTPPALTRLACVVARYHLYADHPTEHVRRAYEDAVRLLEQVAAGKVTLGLDAGGTAPVAESGGAEVSAPERVFTDTLWDTY